MPDQDSSPSHRLHEAVRLLIPKGEVKAFAEKWGVGLRTLMGIRKEPVDTGIETFARIARGLGRSADHLLGLQPPDPAVIAAEKLKREEEADAEFQADLLRGLEQIRARIAKGPKGARK